jgi:DNA-binding response OmpR family regulator
MASAAEKALFAAPGPRDACATSLQASIMPHERDSSFTRRSDASRPMVLIVDDRAEARDLYCACLEFHGFDAQAAEDGASGIAMALAKAPDAMVLDFSMPEMDGAEVLRRLKEDWRTRAIPVVMLTAIPELVDAVVRLACAAFLEKPCEPEVLVRTITDLVGEAGWRMIRLP